MRHQDKKNIITLSEHSAFEKNEVDCPKRKKRFCRDKRTDFMETLFRFLGKKRAIVISFVRMKLDLRKGEKCIFQAHNRTMNQKEYKHTLLKYFYSSLKEETIVTEELRRSLCPMNEDEIRYFFMDETDIWYNADCRERYYLAKRCSLAASTVA